MPRRALFVSCLLLSLAACRPGASPDAGAPAPGQAGSPSTLPQDSERIWAGLLPCRDCQGIDTRLVLRTTQGRREYVLTETYVGGSGKNSFDRAGSWTEVQRMVDGESEVTYVLDPERVAQKFSLQPDGALQLLDAEGKPPAPALDYRLQRL